MTSYQGQDEEQLARLLHHAEWVLLDFDGPVCSLFAGYPARQVAAELHAWIASEAVQLPHATDDPHEVLCQAAGISGDLAREVEKRLRLAEIEAAATAEPTPGAAEFLAACHATGRTVAIVSNNTADAITAYLARTELARYVAHVEGRDRHDTALMKPNPHPLDVSMRAIGASPGKTTFVGDSTSDMHAGTAAHVATIGYANKPGKSARLARAGASVVTDAITNLTAALSM